MLSKQFSVFLVVVVGMLAGCDDAPKPRRPPADDGAETTEDLRERRRTGDATPREPAGTTEDRYGDDRYRNEPATLPSSREERRRPDFRRGESSAAEAAEDQRDADADRPLSAQDE